MLLKLAKKKHFREQFKYSTLAREVFSFFFFDASGIIIIQSCRLVCGWVKERELARKSSTFEIRLQKPSEACNVTFSKSYFFNRS